MDYFPERKKGLIKQEGGGLCRHRHHGDAGSKVIIKTFLHQKAISTSQGEAGAAEMQGSEKEPKLVFWYQPRGSAVPSQRSTSPESVWTIIALTFL